MREHKDQPPSSVTTLDPEALRKTNLERQKLRLAILCLDGSPAAVTDADALLQGPNGADLVQALLLDTALLSKAVKHGFDIGAPFGGTDKVLITLITDANRISVDKIRNLAAAGWQIDMPTLDTGRTALMFAARQWTAFHRHRVEHLIRLGADPFITDKDGKSAHDYAPLAMRDYLETLLRSHAASQQVEKSSKRRTAT